MYLIILGWLYVVVMVVITTAMHPDGGWLMAIFELLFAGVLPIGLMLYYAGHGRRRHADADVPQESRPAADSVSARDAPPPSGQA